MVDKERPFTPPFTKLVPMSSLRSNDKAEVILEKSKDEAMNSELCISQNNLNNNKSNLEEEKHKSTEDFYSRNNNNCLNVLNKSKHFRMEELKNHDVDLIYDHLLGCYYDPKTNMYYELKNN